MQTLNSLKDKQRQENHNANAVRRIYIGPANVPANYPGDLPAHFRSNSNTNQTSSNPVFVPVPIIAFISPQCIN